MNKTSLSAEQKLAVHMIMAQSQFVKNLELEKQSKPLGSLAGRYYDAAFDEALEVFKSQNAVGSGGV